MSGRYNSGGAVPDDGIPKPIPAGEYVMEIVKAVVGKSKTSGHDMVTVTASPIDGEYKGRKVRMFVIFYPTGHKNIGLTLHFLKTIGEPYDGEFDWDETRWTGRMFIANIGIEIFNGEAQNNVRRIRPVEEGARSVSPAQEEEVPF